MPSNGSTVERWANLDVGGGGGLGDRLEEVGPEQLDVVAVRLLELRLFVDQRSWHRRG